MMSNPLDYPIHHSPSAGRVLLVRMQLHCGNCGGAVELQSWEAEVARKLHAKLDVASWPTVRCIWTVNVI